MTSSLSTATDGDGLRRFTAQLLRRWIGELERDRLPIRLPRRRGTMRARAEMPFHVVPELFLQVSGRTHFSFPEERFCLGPGAVCVVPRGLPHRERVSAWQGEFANLVFIYGKNGISFHLARERQRRPCVAVAARLDGVDPVRLGGLLDLLPEGDAEGVAERGTVKGLLLAHFSLLLAGLEERVRPPAAPPEPLKVMQTRHTVAQNLYRPDLSVDWVARSLRTSSGYLSRLFRSATGETLVSHIEEQRIARAYHLLEASSLNVSEVARAIGYGDPSYFARRFRRRTGTTPRGYRRRLVGG